MSWRVFFRVSVAGLAVTLAGLLAWPTAGAAQTLGLLPSPTTTTTTTTVVDTTTTVVGYAKAVQSNVLRTTAVLADTGTLSSTSDIRDASLGTGSVPSALSGEVLHAVTAGWPDQAASEASLANLGLDVAGTAISADFVYAQALAVLGAGGSGSSLIDNLSINGVLIWVTGQPNQTIWIPGGQVVINELQTSLGGTTANALHVIVYGVADVVIASATAGIQ